MAHDGAALEAAIQSDPRIHAIVTSPYARLDPDWAHRLAFFTDLTPNQCFRLLSIPRGGFVTDLDRAVPADVLAATAEA